jgi:hypothetical protein
MTDDLKAPERIWAFDRYVNGVLMAEGVTVTRASSFEEACVKATKLASRGPNNEAPVLVLAHRDAEHIATLEAALADMTQQRRYGGGGEGAGVGLGGRGRPLHTPKGTGAWRALFCG